MVLNEGIIISFLRSQETSTFRAVQPPLSCSLSVLTFVLLLFPLWLSPDLANAEVWFVNVSNENGNEDGLAWSSAFKTVQPAIDAASAAGGGDVLVQAARCVVVRPTRRDLSTTG